MKLKVCGMTQLDQVNELIALKIDFIGFIFYPKSPRYVGQYLDEKTISKINHQGKVGVFVNENLDRLLNLTEVAKLNLVQLHGDESTSYIKQLRQNLDVKVKIIKVLRIGHQPIIQIQVQINEIESDVDYFLFDTDSSAFGGTGTMFDWNILTELKLTKPYFLSGGISVESIEKLQNIKIKPLSLDINSKFEMAPGIKNVALIGDFRQKMNLL